jgi:hypothetical protein
MAMDLGGLLPTWRPPHGSVLPQRSAASSGTRWPSSSRVAVCHSVRWRSSPWRI